MAKFIFTAKENLFIETPVDVTWTKGEKYECVVGDSVVTLGTNEGVSKSYSKTALKELADFFDMEEVENG